MEAALAAGYRIVLMAFSRGVTANPHLQHPDVEIVDLGAIEDGMGVGRVAALWRARRRIAAALKHRPKPTIALYNTLEMLLLGVSAGVRAQSVLYDVTDIHPFQYRRRVVRALEARLLRSIDHLIVSSPWYYWVYYRSMLGYEGPAHLIENKTSPQAVAVGPPTWRSKPRILWNGLLYCETSGRLLLDALSKDSEAFTLRLAGHTEGVESLHRASEFPATQIEQFGPYADSALQAVFASVSFVWCVYVYDDFNSKLALANRLYQAIMHGVPVITLAGTATAKIVEHHQIGIVLERADAASLLDALARVTEARYTAMCASMKALQPAAARGEELRELLGQAGALSLNGSALPAEENISVCLRVPT
ncbi:MAG: hypothetical protein QM674_13665 [Burkholderiaceae bacterium]